MISVAPAGVTAFPDTAIRTGQIVNPALTPSFSEYCLRSAIHDTNEVLFVTYGQLSLIDLEAEHPDYLVIMLVERNLPFLLNGFY